MENFGHLRKNLRFSSITLIVSLLFWGYIHTIHAYPRRISSSIPSKRPSMSTMTWLRRILQTRKVVSLSFSISGVTCECCTLVAFYEIHGRKVLFFRSIHPLLIYIFLYLTYIYFFLLSSKGCLKEITL
jgi:hypothetical protein